MEHYLILARSITYAQRMAILLTQKGIRSAVFRAPMEITSWGCAYVVQIGKPDLSTALAILRNAGLWPVQIFVLNTNGYQEVQG